VHEVLGFDAEGVGELLGRPGPYELPAPVLEAVDWFLGSLDHDGEEVFDAVRCRRCAGTGLKTA